VQSACGVAAWRVQLLVEGLDERGDIVNQKVVWLGIDVPAFGRADFEVPVQKWPHYRVSMFAADWIQSADLRF